MADVAELRVEGDGERHRLSILVDGTPCATSDEIVRVEGDDGGSTIIPIQRSERDGATLTLAGESAPFAAEARWTPATDGAHHDVELSLIYRGSAAARASLRLGLELVTPGRPRWLIPGCFYGENRIAGNRRRFPRWDADGGDAAELVSDRWAFRSDRAALAASCATTERAFIGLATEEEGPLGLAGVGFAGDGATASVWLDLPYREEPVSFIGPERAGPPRCAWHTWEPGERKTVTYSVAVAAAGAHAYAPFLRAMAVRRRATHALNPWMTPAEAAELAAHGLYRWHYQPESGVLYETIAFDRELAGAAGEHGDRAAMHVAWLSGAPHAATLLAYGRRAGDEAYVDAGTAVLDTIATALSPCGAFWGEWRDGRWVGGWNPDPAWLHARTLAEATLFMLRALRAEAAHDTPHPTWERAVRSNLEYVTRHQRADGNLGTYYHAHTGEVMDWTGAAGLLWVAALTGASAHFEQPELLDAGIRAGDYYAGFVDDAVIYGAPEDVHLTPTSEDGYNAVIAYVALCEATNHPRWLRLARDAADWMLTFRLAHNVVFEPETLLGEYDFRTRGADIASPSNQHLHAYGLICLPEMLRLARLTGDDELRIRTQDNLACFLQLVARRDGDFNAYRGMVSERYYQTDWAQAKGMLLTLSHAWSVGLLLYAAQHAMEDPDALPV